MKKAYIKRVKQLLPLMGKRRKEVLRSLNEMFDSGAEQGSKQSALVYSRLGSPEEYVRDVCESFGIPQKRIKARQIARKLVFIPILIVILVIISFLWRRGLPWEINETFTVTSWETGESFEVTVDIQRHLVTRIWQGTVTYNGRQEEILPSDLQNENWGQAIISVWDQSKEEAGQNLFIINKENILIIITNRNGQNCYQLNVIASDSGTVPAPETFVGPASTVEEALEIIGYAK